MFFHFAAEFSVETSNAEIDLSKISNGWDYPCKLR